MHYCYAKFNGLDLLCLRVGGPGLGNLLFPWARAKLLAKMCGYHFISPTWPQLKIGPALRREFDSRNYVGIFKPLPEEVHGLRRFFVLLTHRRISEYYHDQAKAGDIIVVSGQGNSFQGFEGQSIYLRDALMKMSVKNRVFELEQLYKCEQAIAVHVRYGDFIKLDSKNIQTGLGNSRLPIEWYVAAVNSLREELGARVAVNLFSDAKDNELAPLMELPVVTRITGNSAIEDMLLLGRHRVLVASGSTFSMWGAYLGQLPTLWFPGSKEFCLLDDSECEIEYAPGQDLKAFCNRVSSRMASPTPFM